LRAEVVQSRPEVNASSLERHFILNLAAQVFSELLIFRGLPLGSLGV
jgi:hypothetical protein